MSRIVRYQGAIIQDDHILLLQQRHEASGRSTWLLPGGGIEAGETEEECVQREMLEETCLSVEVLGVLLDEPAGPGAVYQRHKTFLCKAIAGEARPGYEPEAEYSAAYTFTNLGWLDLRSPSTWPEDVASHSWTYPLLQRLRAVLGYSVAPTADGA